MKRFIFILIALIATLTIGAQSIRLDNAGFSNTVVVQQHIDVGHVFQNTYIYSFQTILPGVVTTYYNVQPNTMTIANNIQTYTSSTTQYRRGVGLINNNNESYNAFQTINLIRDVGYTKNNYQNVQKYYCNN